MAWTDTVPSYLTAIHQDLLQNSADAVGSSGSFIDVLNAASNPYASKSAYDPDTRTGNILTKVDTYRSAIATFITNIGTNFSSDITTAEGDIDDLIDSTYIANEVSDYTDIVNDSIGDVLFPKFAAGMQSVNAVMTSAYAVGKGIITAYAERDIAKFNTELVRRLALVRLESILKAAQVIHGDRLHGLDFHRSALHYNVEGERMALVAEKEELEQQLAIDTAEEKWPFELYQYGANLIASIQGGTSYPNTDTKSPSTAQSALAGALAGAAIGAQISGSWQGGAIGGLLGIGAALLG